MASRGRGMDWPTAWRGTLLLYAFAVLLQDLIPLIAVPVWAFFVIYGRHILSGARTARDPWGGRMGPRIYLIAFVPLIAAALVGYAAISTIPQGEFPPLNVFLVYVVTDFFALGLAATFMAASAPPSTRAQRGYLSLALLAAFLSAFVQSSLVTLFFALDPVQAVASAIGLSAASILGLFSADRVARLQPSVARRVPRT